MGSTSISMAQRPSASSRNWRRIPSSSVCYRQIPPKAPPNALPGSYKAEAFNIETNTFHATSQLQIAITVDEVFDNDHRVVSQTSTSSNSMSKFTFSAADSGQHRLCFTPSGPAAISVGGWFSGAGASAGGVKLTVDLAIGETSKIESEDKSKIESIVGRVRELNGRLQDIRREQVFQRVCAPNTSAKTNTILT
jgi:p24 family protein alpha